MSKIKVLMALCLTLLLLAVSCVLAGEEYQQDFSKTLPLKAGDRFSLENVNGDITVATWKNDQVEIKAVKTARRNKADLDKVEIRVDEGTGSVSVKAIWPKFPRRANVTVQFTVMVPEGVNLDDVDTVNGSVDVTGRYGEMEVGTTNGGITVEDASGDLSADTTNGSVRVARFEGRIDAETTNGNIRLEGIAVTGGLTAGTTNGSITLSIGSPEALNADLSAATTNGSVTVDFPVTLESLTRSRRRIEAKIGQGGLPIDLRTTNGSIKLTR